MPTSLTTTRRAFLLAAGASAAILSGKSAAESGDDTTLKITGELTYLQRIALPVGSVAIVEIKPSDSPDGASVTAEVEIELDGRQVPVAFALDVARDRLDTTKSYLLRGAIRVGGNVRWLSDPVEVDIAAQSLDLGTILMAAYVPSAPFDMDDPQVLQDIEWRITEMVDAQIPDDIVVTLTFGRDGAFYGGACNRFRGAYHLQRNSLSFGRVAGTLMACPEPQMTVERKLFETLDRVKGFTVTRAGSLWLRDSEGNALIVAWQ